ncbi:MAG TPA: hypothetical protein VEC11_07800 [Allosphingosinicella sp.]|nr:hypothetical protein [Allosphingosinicella sp.]
MFVVTKEKLARMHVEWNTLDDAGATVTNSFGMKVKLVELDRFEEFIAAFASGRTGSAMLGEDQAEKPPLLLRDFIAEVARDWDGIIDEAKKPFPFNPENLAVIIQQPNFIVGWALSYIKAWNGQSVVREGNSGGSSGAGPAGAGNRQQRLARQSKPKQSGGR